MINKIVQKCKWFKTKLKIGDINSQWYVNAIWKFLKFFLHFFSFMKVLQNSITSFVSKILLIKSFKNSIASVSHSTMYLWLQYGKVIKVKAQIVIGEKIL